jgi:hypothetical protein
LGFGPFRGWGTGRDADKTAKKEPLNPLVLGLPETPHAELKDYLHNPNDWGSMREQLANTPSMTLNEATAYLTIFGAEGGMKKNLAGGSAVGGILNRSLQEAKAKAPDLTGLRSTADLKVEHMPTVYRAHFDNALRKAGGHEALNSVPDSSAAAALADTIFRSGEGQGANIIREAINDVGGDGTVKEKGILDHATLAAYNNLVGQPETRYQLLDKIGNLRDDANDEGKRNEFFRFRETW